MKISLLQFIWLFTVILLNANSAQGASEESFTFGRFGKIAVYRTVSHPSQVVLFVSGDEGWNSAIADMARELSSLDALIVGIDISHYLNELEKSPENYSYPVNDLKRLSKFVQKKLHYSDCISPVLFGYASGAAFVYASLAQAPSQTFTGAISMNFCPRLPLTKPFARGNGLEWKQEAGGKGFSFFPARNLDVRWIVLQDITDQTFTVSEAEKYIAQVPQSELILLPGSGHGSPIEKQWMPQFKQAFSHIVAKKENDLTPLSDDLNDLPLVEVPSKQSSTNCMAVIVTGDGGWRATDRGIANDLAKHGVPAVGLNSLRYFWNRRTPEGSSIDLERILRHFLALWQKEKVILIGYSRGADMLPFMINRLPEKSFIKIQSVILLGPDEWANFKFHIIDWFVNPVYKTSLPVIPEIQKLREMKLFCFFGKEDQDAICERLDSSYVNIIPLKGGHKIGNNYDPIVAAILKEIE